MRQIIFKGALWVYVITWSLWCGGMAYELAVITPVWSGNMPQSIIEWNSRPEYAIIPTGFFAPVAVTTIIASLAALFASWKIGQQRRVLLISAICAVLTLGFTLIYFFPKNEVIFHARYHGMSPEEVVSVGRAWLTGSWIRAALMIIGFVTALRAFATQYQGSSE